jgi:hypothetical protein
MNEEVEIASNSSKQDKKLFLVPIAVLVIAVVTIGLIYIFNGNKNGNTTISNQSNEGSLSDPIQKNNGSLVDHATYLQIQGLMQQTPFSKPEVIESSLRSFDIDRDGDQDVLGFLKLTFSYDSDYVFSTWYNNGTYFDYYEDGYDYFRLSEKYEGGLSCSIYDLAVAQITLSCDKSGQKYLTTLRYQKNGTGYYRDVDAHVVTSNDNANWLEYISKKGGINFDYPPDVQISEKTYEIYSDLITIITAKHNGQILFEIKTVPEEPNQGGSTIMLAQKIVFLKLSDGTYLSRNWMEGSDLKSVFYNKANAYRENNVGSVGASNDQTNINKNRSYVLFTPITSENDLKEIDNIFASIKYIEIPATKDAETIVPKNNSVLLSNLVMLQVSGNITEQQTTEKNPLAVGEKDIKITFIDSLIYQPALLNIELLPFGSVGGRNVIGGGGYDISKNGCYGYEKDVFTALEKVGANQVCRFGYGDAGISVQGYYVLDPSRKYILVITQDSSFSDFDYETIHPNLKAVVESVQFNQ